jgi:hypothetical protein
MKACVFVGPTLRAQDLPAGDDIVVLPPVAQGEVYRVAQMRPQAIGIIDGYFEGVLSVWHKEILWAMAEGIHVFGSASMGALRAAELHSFGMVGVGRIFEAYRDGGLEDDDEVAVIHGPRETGYVALSEAMVNIRRTLFEAERAGVITAPSRDALVGLAKDLFYHDRTFERLLQVAEGSLPPGEVEALRTWLPDGRVDQKRDDAMAMLQAIKALLASGPQPMRVEYTLEWTEVWDDATLAAAASPFVAPRGAPGQLADERVLEELRLEPDTYAAVRDRALLRFLAAREAQRRRSTADTGALRDVLDRLRARHGLSTRADLERWLAANAIDGQRLERILEDEARHEAIGALAAPSLSHALLDELRLRNEFARFAARARDKQAALEAHGLGDPIVADAQAAPPPALRAWYFERRLGRPLPDDIDAAARELGFANRADFDRALRREWLYLGYGDFPVEHALEAMGEDARRMRGQCR